MSNQEVEFVNSKDALFKKGREMKDSGNTVIPDDDSKEMIIGYYIPELNKSFKFKGCYGI